MSRHYARDDEGFRDGYYGVDSRPRVYNLQPPLSAQRPRSVPPPSAAVVERSYMMTPATRSHSRNRGRSRSRGRSSSSSCSRSRSRSHSRSRRKGTRASRSRGRDGPVEKAEKAVKNSFTSSNSGLGIGILGAIVGGLAARHVSDSAPQRRHDSGHHGDRERDQRVLMSTIVGAAVGGLGANALERRLEINREKKMEEDEARGRAGRRDKDDDDDRHHRHSRHRHQHDHDHHNHHLHRHYHSRHDGVDHVYDEVYEERPVRRRRSLDGPERRPYRPLDYRP